MVAEAAGRGREPVPEFAAFTLREAEGVDVLHARKVGDRTFLRAADGSAQFAVRSTNELPFDRVANDPRMAIMRDGRTWRLAIRDPRLSMNFGE